MDLDLDFALDFALDFELEASAGGAAGSSREGSFIGSSPSISTCGGVEGDGGALDRDESLSDPIVYA